MPHLTTSQMATLKLAIAAETDAQFVVFRDQGATGAMADFYNQPAVPTFTVWKTNVPVGDVGKALIATAVAAITAGANDKLQTFAIYNPSGFNPSRADTRAFFDDIFSGASGTTTRTALLALWKRPAKRIAKMFATGTGTDASPATMVFEGTISNEDIVVALQ